MPGVPANANSGGRLDMLTPLTEKTPRRLALLVHERLRELILQRAVPPGIVLKQTEVARLLGVSRTPIREAFRMLQEEGLIIAEPDQRATVVGLDLSDLDAIYASRILLECLAVGVTTVDISPAELRELDEALSRMRKRHRQHRTSLEYAKAHQDFHYRTIAGGPPELVKEVRQLMDRTHRYLRLAQLGNVDNWPAAERGHQAVLNAMRRHAQAEAVAAMADHLATTAQHVVTQIDPGHPLPTVAAAVSILRGEGSGLAGTENS